eukprot:scaffold34347_cov118-Isochrysis_galbana.AAC.2
MGRPKNSPAHRALQAVTEYLALQVERKRQLVRLRQHTLVRREEVVGAAQPAARLKRHAQLGLVQRPPRVRERQQARFHRFGPCGRFWHPLGGEDNRQAGVLADQLARRLGRRVRTQGLHRALHLLARKLSHAGARAGGRPSSKRRRPGRWRGGRSGWGGGSGGGRGGGRGGSRLLRLLRGGRRLGGRGSLAGRRRASLALPRLSARGRRLLGLLVVGRRRVGRGGHGLALGRVLGRHLGSCARRRCLGRRALLADALARGRHPARRPGAIIGTLRTEIDG